MTGTLGGGGYLDDDDALRDGGRWKWLTLENEPTLSPGSMGRRRLYVDELEYMRLEGPYQLPAPAPTCIVDREKRPES